MEAPCHYGVENEVSVGNGDNITDTTLRFLPVFQETHAGSLQTARDRRPLFYPMPEVASVAAHMGMLFSTWEPNTHLLSKDLTGFPCL